MDHAGLAVGVAFARAVEVAGTASQDSTPVIRSNGTQRLPSGND